jgi:hypothetical protein
MIQGRDLILTGVSELFMLDATAGEISLRPIQDKIKGSCLTLLHFSGGGNGCSKAHCSSLSDVVSGLIDWVRIRAVPIICHRVSQRKLSVNMNFEENIDQTTGKCEVSDGDFSEGRGRKVELIAGRVWIDLYLRDGENPVSNVPPEVLEGKRN